MSNPAPLSRSSIPAQPSPSVSMEPQKNAGAAFGPHPAQAGQAGRQAAAAAPSNGATDPEIQQQIIETEREIHLLETEIRQEEAVIQQYVRVMAKYRPVVYPVNGQQLEELEAGTLAEMQRLFQVSGDPENPVQAVQEARRDAGRAGPATQAAGRPQAAPAPGKATMFSRWSARTR